MTVTQFCGIKPKYPPHQFCGKICAKQSASSNNHCQVLFLSTFVKLIITYIHSTATKRQDTLMGMSRIPTAADSVLGRQKVLDLPVTASKLRRQLSFDSDYGAGC